ncbi:DUF1801 domain-containing protein [Aequorivita sp. 609]|uniref:YdeI/OmpD-associated family protein n=1 Tax=Aequorivita TaxID=153265 RepID=UPI00161F0167|nr:MULTISPECIES: DUF1801 domain-containing protein [Aequorivita]MBB6680125.1 DUF1801 domain-containing protein [Aequorivita sp. 609]
MTDSEKVDIFIHKQTKWKDKLQLLRSVIQQTELKEEVKWGKPTYTLNGKLVVAMADFKNHLALWFHQGVFLKDEAKTLINAQEGVTKALRQWRFKQDDEINPKLILQYVEEAIENAKAGKEIKPVKKKNVSIPLLLKSALATDKVLKESFNKLTPGRQREYAEYIGEAKREATQLKRLDKSSELIKKGVGLHDKYKNC